jgi:hypothetical protein
MTTEIKRPEPGSLGSPFESIRSSEIIPIFQRWFTIEWKLEFSAFLHLIVPPGTRAIWKTAHWLLSKSPHRQR